jgi:hypothetical protein
MGPLPPPPHPTPHTVLCSWIRTHDPVSVDDRQIVLLESITVNMDQVKAAVSAVATLLTAEVRGSRAALTPSSRCAP